MPELCTRCSALSSSIACCPRHSPSSSLRRATCRRTCARQSRPFRMDKIGSWREALHCTVQPCVHKTSLINSICNASAEHQQNTNKTSTKHQRNSNKTSTKHQRDDSNITAAVFCLEVSVESDVWDCSQHIYYLFRATQIPYEYVDDFRVWTLCSAHGAKS